MSREECAQRRGNCFRRTVAAMKPEAQPRPRQDSQQHKDALGRTTPIRKETWPARHPRKKVSAARLLTQERPFPTTSRNMPLPMQAAMLTARCRASKQGRAAIREPSFVTHRQRTASVVDGTHSHNLPQQAPAHPPSTAQRRGVDLGRAGAAGAAVSRGAKPRAAGMARRAFPWRQAQRAVPQARRQLDEESGVPPAYCNAAA